ncbi:hypothetical protein FN846DRAFT_447821 [Sphaerosporella brunnea]|uniref:DUF202 domain-containing protein n=1 Tax=Sphaerosporella brunnea TaxID=1250544 RepID=A0A5J5F435_9PEZI|nr:hypothetical protein FN846DRAFT_447821 [Sphaerosporella brunnea]
MLERHASLRYHFRGHRARSVQLTPSELIEIRAAQRTFEGAYVRTALSQFSFALVVLKIFTHEFYPIGALFAAFGTAILFAALVRRRSGNRQFFTDGEARRFRTSGNVVTLVTCISITAYSVLLVLILRLK